MKKTRKKGFTIVELVIVIAVIAILAAVLIPTFSNVIASAKKSNALQTARADWYNCLANMDAEKIDACNYSFTVQWGSETADTVTYYIEKGSFVGDKEVTGATAITYDKSSHTFTIPNS